MSATYGTPVIPVVSVLTGPSVWMVPSGFSTVTVTLYHPGCGHAVWRVTPAIINTSWPTPIGLGIGIQMENVFIVPCAVTAGKAKSVAEIVNNRTKVVVEILDLFLRILILFFPPHFSFT